MRSYASVLAVLSAVLLATQTSGLIYTTTLGVGQYLDGNTEIVSVGTNALGLAVTSVLSTLNGAAGAAAGAGGALTTAATTTGKKTTTTGRPTTTQQPVVGNTPTANGPPMKTTTYFYPGPDGNWVEATWTASVTAMPTVATVVVPAGTIQDYNTYQASANSVVLASALASATGKTSGAQRIVSGGVEGWIAMAVGAIGAGMGVMLM